MAAPSPAEFFSNLDADHEVERDHGRPLVVPAGGGVAVPYTRASSLADYIADHRHIHRWEMRYLAKALGQNPDLAHLAAVETYSTGSDEPPRREKTASGRRLDSIIERALDRAKIHEKADYGTAVHAATEPDNREPVPAQMVDDVTSFGRAIQDAAGEILATEVFIVNDDVQAAGTFDHLVRFPGLGIVILDKKTGKENAHEFGIQFSVYANGDVYNPKTHGRLALDGIAGEVNRQVAIAAMIKDGRTRFVEIDIEEGWQGAQAAALARDYVEGDGLSSDATMTMLKRARKERDALAESLSVASDEATLGELWRGYKHLWLPEHTELAAARKRFLTTPR